VRTSGEEAHNIPFPLTVTGPTGSGKTHFARGLTELWQDRFGPDAARFTPAVDFARAFSDTDDWTARSGVREAFRNASLLALDDLDRLPRRISVQRELLATIDSIDRDGGLVIIASSELPGRSSGLTLALRSRLLGGLVLPLALPRKEARTELARRFAAQNQIRLTEEEVDAVVGPFEATPRNIAQRIAHLEMCRERGEPAAAQDQPQCLVPLRTITAVTARFFSLRQAEIRGSSRRRSLVDARSIAIFLARELSGQSLARIGREYGDRDHSTILHAVRKVADRLAGDESTRSAVMTLRRILLSS
jgi:chromosomal replication initiator protein